MYRCAANYKTCESFAFINDGDYSHSEIDKWKNNHLVTEEVLALKYNLPNIAPIDSPLEDAGRYDHCYMEITGCEGVNNLEKMKQYSDVKVSERSFKVIYNAMINDQGVEDWKTKADEYYVNLDDDKTDIVGIIIKNDVLTNPKPKIRTTMKKVIQKHAQ